jgi:hypothetical protein
VRRGGHLIAGRRLSVLTNAPAYRTAYAFLACAVLAMSGGHASAQGISNAASGPRSPMCGRLEGQLASLDRAPGDARAEQIRRYEEAANRQQGELDRLTAQQRRMGCEGGFFLFGGGQSQQCDQINAQVQRMRSNLDRMLTGLRQLQGSGTDRDEQRRAILISLAQYDCGPQYRSAQQPQQQRPRGIFETLFGGGGGQQGAQGAPDYPTDPTLSSTFKTLCVRTCDGSFFPISNSANQSRFREDERICQRACPAGEVALYTHRSQGEQIAQAVSIEGRPYTELPNAFKYRQEFNPACTCKRAGESWAEAVPDDPTLERGDVVVTEERAKALSQPRAEPQRPPPRQEPRQGQRQGQTQGRPQAQPQGQTRGRTQRTGAIPAQASAVTPAAEPQPEVSGIEEPPAISSAPSERPRAVGPQFYR